MSRPEGTQFVTEPSPSLICPICQDLFLDPVITSQCHHSFCRECLTKSIQQEQKCPMCRTNINSTEFHSNLALKGLVSEILVFCPFKDIGCVQTMRFELLNQHVENECSFIPKKCIYSEFGCNFVGVSKTRTEHLKSCVYHELRAFIEKTNHRINQLEKIVVQQQKQIQLLENPQVALNSLSKINTNIKAEPIGVDELSPMRTTIAEHNFANNEIFCVKTISSTSGVTSVVQSLGSIYSGSYDGSLKVYDAYSGTLLKTKKEHQLSIWGLAIDEQLNRLYTGASDGKFNIWNLEDNEIINSIDIGVKNNRIYCASSDSDIHILDKITYSEMGCLKGHTGGVNSITFNDDKLISASSDKSIKIWDLNTLVCEHTISHNPSEVLNVKTGYGMLFSSNYDATINIFSLNDYRRISSLNEHRWV